MAGFGWGGGWVGGEDYRVRVSGTIADSSRQSKVESERECGKKKDSSIEPLLQKARARSKDQIRVARAARGEVISAPPKASRQAI